MDAPCAASQRLWVPGIINASARLYMRHTQGDTENCEGWLSPGGHGSGGGALTAKVRGPQFDPGWLPVFHEFSKTCLKIFHHVRILLNSKQSEKILDKETR